MNIRSSSLIQSLAVEPDATSKTPRGSGPSSPSSPLGPRSGQSGQPSNRWIWMGSLGLMGAIAVGLLSLSQPSTSTLTPTPTSQGESVNPGAAPAIANP